MPLEQYPGRGNSEPGYNRYSTKEHGFRKTAADQPGAGQQVSEAEKIYQKQQEILKEKQWEVRALEVKLRNAEDELKKLRQEWRVANENAENAKFDVEIARKRFEVEKNFLTPKQVTLDNREAFKKDYQFREGIFHIAVVGNPGNGKTSLIKAAQYMGSADTTIPANETPLTAGVTRIRVPRSKLAWYDFPAPTNGVRARTYFKDYGLYVFDAILILIGDRITNFEGFIIKNSQFWGIPRFLVQTGSDKRIWAICRQHNLREADARARVDKHQREVIKGSLETFEYELPETEIYLISNNTLRYQIFQPRELNPSSLDEELLLRDIWKCVACRTPVHPA